MTTLLLALLFGLPLALVASYLLFPGVIANALRTRGNRGLALDAYNAASDYSRPGFLPQRSELPPTALRVEGTLPAGLAGCYLRNGTNYQFDTVASRRHMFNGAGMLHAVQFKDGQCTYTNTYVRTPRFEAERELGREAYAEFGDIAGGGKSALLKILAEGMEKRRGLIPAIPDLDNGSNTTAIQFHHGRLYALQETCRPFALDTRLDDGRLVLSGGGRMEDFGGRLNAPFTAHPKIDPATGDWYLYSTDIRSGSAWYGRLSGGELVKFDRLFEADPAIAFLHDYYLTAQYSVFPDVSLRCDMKRLTGEDGSPFFFDPQHPLRFGVVRREHSAGDEVQWFTTDQPGHIWHVINGWEEARADGGTDIVLFAPVFRDYQPDVPIHSTREPHTSLWKYRLNLDTGEVSEQCMLVDHFYERPSFNTDYIGQPSRYAYLLDEGGAGGIMGKGVQKYDLLEERAVAYFDYGDLRGGEALFVSREGSTEEDDGYLLDLLMGEEQACLVVIDARTMTELARVHLPQRVPYGVHGCWLSPAQLAQLA